ncbi:MAG: hypothetical protein ABIH90_02225 [Candidatus Aenigmatarchaeota archaeon]
MFLAILIAMLFTAIGWMILVPFFHTLDRAFMLLEKRHKKLFVSLGRPNAWKFGDYKALRFLSSDKLPKDKELAYLEKRFRLLRNMLAVVFLMDFVCMYFAVFG